MKKIERSSRSKKINLNQFFVITTTLKAKEDIVMSDNFLGLPSRLRLIDSNNLQKLIMNQLLSVETSFNHQQPIVTVKTEWISR